MRKKTLQFCIFCRTLRDAQNRDFTTTNMNDNEWFCKVKTLLKRRES